MCYDLRKANTVEMQQLLLEMGMASCIHKVKHYFALQNDEVFPIGQIPDRVKNVALRGEVKRTWIQAALRSAFPAIDPERFEVDDSVVTFHSQKEERWTPYQRKFAELMLAEILPVGSTAKVDTGLLDT